MDFICLPIDLHIEILKKCDIRTLYSLKSICKKLYEIIRQKYKIMEQKIIDHKIHIITKYIWNSPIVKIYSDEYIETFRRTDTDNIYDDYMKVKKDSELVMSKQIEILSNFPHYKNMPIGMLFIVSQRFLVYILSHLVLLRAISLREMHINSDKFISIYTKKRCRS